MTRIDPPSVTTTRAQAKRDLRTAAATAAMLFSWAFAAHNLSVADAGITVRVDSEMERVMLAACRLPEVNGAVTIFTMRGNRLECGRYK